MRKLIAALVMLFGAAPVASANIVVTRSGCGTHSATSVWNTADQAWEVDINATVSCNGALVLFVRADLPLASIKHVNINATRESGVTTGYVIINISPQSYPFDTIPKLGSIQRVSGNAPIFVSATDIGQLGFSSSAPASISAADIGTISVRKNAGLTGYTGNVYASISATAASPLQGNITAILCDGDFYGSVTASNWIESIIAGGDIGSFGSPSSVSFGNYLQALRGS